MITCWISIVRAQSRLSNWTAADITTVQAKLAIEYGWNSWPATESLFLRFWNHQVREELDSVLRSIWFALEERHKSNPSRSSSPFGKGRGDSMP